MSSSNFTALSDMYVSRKKEMMTYYETHKTVNTRNIHGMLLCCEEKATKA